MMRASGLGGLSLESDTANPMPLLSTRHSMFVEAVTQLRLEI